jgi:hypothetical protein
MATTYPTNEDGQLRHLVDTLTDTANVILAADRTAGELRQLCAGVIGWRR